MAIESLALIRADLARIEADAAALGAVQPAAALDGGSPHAGTSFADSMKDVIHSVDAKDRIASDKAAAVDSGRSDDLVGAMLASQEASLSFSMLMQVRNKVMGAFDELIKLQI
ncbi:MAG TPA: flagellar hook-basal body complex protein FliE [Azonexus sp.]